MRQQLKHSETRKLFFTEYLYKLVLRNDLSNIFRTELQGKEKLSYVRKQLDQLTENYRNNLPLYKKAWRAEVALSETDYFDAITVYNALKNSNDYKIRIDPYSQVTLFSNNKALLLDLANKLYTSHVEFWEPKAEHISLLSNKTKIKIVDVPPTLELKVYFNSKKVNAEFAAWINANRDKCKIGDIAFSSIHKHGYLSGLYMFVRDEKVLNLVMLIVGNSIRSVEKLVYVPNIDK
tara:strand:- start:772 stop:1476 length:705 start_codon:yes stop_codon:yes gene_type:complete